MILGYLDYSLNLPENKDLSGDARELHDVCSLIGVIYSACMLKPAMYGKDKTGLYAFVFQKEEDAGSVYRLLIKLKMKAFEPEKTFYYPDDVKRVRSLPVKEQKKAFKKLKSHWGFYFKSRI